MPVAKPAKVYAVQIGRTPGIYMDWDSCLLQVSGFPGAKYKKFTDVYDAEVFVRGSPDKATTSPTRATAASPTRESATSPTKRHSPKPYEKLLFQDKTESPVKASIPVTKSPKNEAAQAMDVGDAFVDKKGWEVAYCDGACKGNGKPGSIAGIGVWWGSNDTRNLAERCPGVQTNNRAELIALVRLLETAPITKDPLLIKTDSKYVMQCIKDWLPNWQKQNWRTARGKEVKNLEIIRYISSLLSIRGQRGQKVDFMHVYGHTGEVGNEGADMMANRGCLLPELEDRNWAEEEERLGGNLNDLKLASGSATTSNLQASSNLAPKVPLQRMRSSISVSELNVADYEDVDMDDFFMVPTPSQQSVRSQAQQLPSSAQTPRAPQRKESQNQQHPVQVQRQPYSTQASSTASRAPSMPPPPPPSKPTEVNIEDVDLSMYADYVDDLDIDENGDFL